MSACSSFERLRDKNDISIDKVLTYTFLGVAHRTSNYRCGRKYLQHEERGKWLDFKAWHCRERWQASGGSILNSPVLNYVPWYMKGPLYKVQHLEVFLDIFWTGSRKSEVVGLAVIRRVPFDCILFKVVCYCGIFHHVFPVGWQSGDWPLSIDIWMLVFWASFFEAGRAASGGGLQDGVQNYRANLPRGVDLLLLLWHFLFYPTWQCKLARIYNHS